MEYNTSQPQIQLPEYGRLVEQMVKEALTIEDRAERQAYAERIIDVMCIVDAGRQPGQGKQTPEYIHKLWDHLALMAGYSLDIDYPVDITRKSEHYTPAHLSYPTNDIRFRHYGVLVERVMEMLRTIDDDQQRDALILQAANRMKRNLADWKGDGIEDEKVARDIARYTDGAVAPDFAGGELMAIQSGYVPGKKKKKLN
ncbi:MAG: DUF4290 domain-containing protein [Alloprevotella sp.]